MSNKSKIQKYDKLQPINILNFENIKIISDISEYNEICKNAVKLLLLLICKNISMLTDVCYHPMQPKIDDSKIIIPVTVQYHNDEGKLVDIINKRVNVIKEMIENMKFENNKEMAIARIIKTYNLDPFNLIQINYNLSDSSELVNINCSLNLPEIPNATIKEVYYPKLNFRHLEYIDPLLLDYGLYVGLSKDFKQMGYCYNALHIYEHMMTCPWNNLDKKDLTLMNGSTYPTGKCYLYNVHSSEQSLKEYTIKYVEEHTKSKQKEFWTKDYYEDLKRESIRTYSETQAERSLKSFARTDPYVYKNMIYDYKPFIKFSNDSYTILTVSPIHIDFEFDKLEDKCKKLEKCSDIEEQKFNFIPLTALRNNDNIIILNKKDLTDKIFKHNSVLIGNDCVGIIRGDNEKEAEENNTCVLFILDHNINDINKFMKGRVFPITNNGFNEIDLCGNLYNAYNMNM